MKDKPVDSAIKSTIIPLDLDEYRPLVGLDELFEAPDPVADAEVGRAILVNKLLTYLQSDGTVEYSGMDVRMMHSAYRAKRRLLQALLTLRSPGPLPGWFLTQLDSLLQREASERGIAKSTNLPRVAQTMPGSSYSAANHTAVWRGDITTLEADAIVNAANAQMLGCFQPFHGCIDNVIHSAAGPRVREDCQAIMQLQGHPEGTGWAKITRAYNLPARFILHTVGPIVGQGPVRSEHEQQLAASYGACLDLACRVHQVRSVAFCCISTGVFGFPQEPAARIALETVDHWLSDHPTALDLVVFNVFTAVDLEIYTKVLRE